MKRPKYKIERGTFSDAWFIAKRRFYFWYRPLLFKKMVYREDGTLCGGCPSIEQLYFKIRKNAEMEVVNLINGVPAIEFRHWKNGRLVKVLRKGGAIGKRRL